MHKVCVASLEKVAFSKHSHEHIETFVVHKVPCKGQKHPGNITDKDLAERDIIVPKCLIVHKHGKSGGLTGDVSLWLEYREHEVLYREEIVEKVDHLPMLIARCQGHHG